MFVMRLSAAFGAMHPSDLLVDVVDQRHPGRAEEHRDGQQDDHLVFISAIVS
ncbi:MAG TPA: hypothetical protein VNA57_00255 [Acidimicrobiales bacterium]|nr:hypothetical protein [Acidimicrobiales bacterium]